jgi:cell division septal protein FtsQ
VGRLALVQSHPVRRDINVPWRQLVLGVLATAALLALLYFAARETPVFAVRHIEVSGGSASVRRAVENAASSADGTSLVGLDGDALVDELEALPAVRSASYDRAFPSTLRIFVQPEAPLAVVRLGKGRWVVSERGRIIRGYVADPMERYPRFRLPERPNVVPGSFVTDFSAKVILRALAVVPNRFPARIDQVRLEGGRLTMRLRAPWGAPELRLGEPVDLQVKLAVAALLIRSFSADYRTQVAYLDVSVPERSVAGATLKSKVEP